jgi:hypothetical protein
MKFTRRRLTWDSLDKPIPLKEISEKGYTSVWEGIIKYLKDMDV